MVKFLLGLWITLSLLMTAEVVMAVDDAHFRHISFGSSPSTVEPPVDFLEFPPVIDGRLDDSLRFLEERQFTFAYVLQDDSVSPASYRLAYGAGFFYVYLEMAGDRLIYRDRAYQNGDGFHMVIAAPQPDQAPSDEFYVLACSAVNEPSQEWTRRIFWYYNVDKIFVPTSENAKLECRQGDGKISFELLLPWTDVRPYHPWLSEAIGFNLRTVKAIEPDRVMLFGVVDDPYIDSEQRKRQYALLSFQPPVVHHSTQTFVQPTRSNIEMGDSLEIVSANIAPATGTSELTVSIYTGEGERILNQQISQECARTLKNSTFRLNTSALPVGGYKVRWSSEGGINRGECGLTVLPDVDLPLLTKRIESIRSKVSTSTVSTLQFLVDDTQHKLKSVYPYETCGEMRIALDGLVQSIEHAESGIDDFAHATGFVRKAYRSRIDASLQPYMVWLPSDYSRDKNYPLFVYLHGSASDEKSFTKRGASEIIPDGFIAVAPFGRGKSNAFCADHAQDDIAEVIATVSQDYSVDTNAILLGGFSMGGYGVFRTAYETPGKFKALAIVSGDPTLGQRYSGDSTQPDFLEDRNLKAFKNLPIFIFHGEKDRNCAFETTQKLVEKLQKAGARVQFVSESDKGHDFPNSVTIQNYRQWVMGIFGTLR
ncbi:MAG: prolyl oligopeptidase family serine peptidase [bacterium]|nr:prolyl oligopeptidase family serine peptidase [bacterium]